MKIENLNQDHLQALLNTPHQIYLVDDLLSTRITGFKSEITFGNINPAGQPQTAVSITLSTDDLYRIAKTLITEIERNKTDIARQHTELMQQLGN